MIRGIYRYHVFSEPINPSIIGSIYNRAFYVFGDNVAKELVRKFDWFPYIADALLSTANAAMTHWANNKKARGYLHETGDLLKSMGVAIYHRMPLTKGSDIVYQFATSNLASGFNMSDRAWKHLKENKDVHNEHLYPYTYTYLNHEKSGRTRIRKKTVYKLRKRHHENPVKQFELAAESYKTHIGNGKGGWEVLFMATMPYAPRLEVDYGKSVLIKSINWIDNEFIRRIGLTPNKSDYLYMI